MTFKFGEVQRNLRRKDSIDPDAAHPYFYFYRNGKKTRFYTYTSHGKSVMTLVMRFERDEDVARPFGTLPQVRDLVACTINAKQYLALLIASGACRKSRPRSAGRRGSRMNLGPKERSSSS